jgi:hypothetical protein
MRQDDRILDKIAKRWLRDAARGDNRAREQLLDRLEGKVEQKIDATITSRYVIEEVGVEHVDIEASSCDVTLAVSAPASLPEHASAAIASETARNASSCDTQPIAGAMVTSPASDNTPYVAECAGESGVAPAGGVDQKAEEVRGIRMSGGPTDTAAPGPSE